MKWYDVKIPMIVHGDNGREDIGCSVAIKAKSPDDAVCMLSWAIQQIVSDVTGRPTGAKPE